MSNLFNKSGRVHAPDAKYTGEEPDWHGWERWSVEKFFSTRARALRFYTYYLDAASLKPIVLAWMKKEGYSKDDISALKEAPPWYVPATVGKLIRMLDRGMPSFHPDASEYFAALPLSKNDEGEYVPCTQRDIAEGVKEDLRVSLANIRRDRPQTSNSTADVKTKKNISPIDRLREKVDKEIMIYVDELIDRWADPSKGIATINLAGMLRDHKIPSHCCKPILDWIDKNLEEYNGAYDKSEPQLVEGYSYLKKPQLKKIIDVLQSMRADVAAHSKMKNATRKPRVKKPKAADKQISRLKYQDHSAEYSLTSIAPSRIPYSQRLYIFNTKTRQLGVYHASGNGGFEVKGTSLKGYDQTNSFHATLRKPADILTGILGATPKKLDKILDGVKITKKKANGRFNEHTVILKVLEHRP